MTAIGTPVALLVNRCPDPTMESGVASAQVSNNATLYPLTYDNTQSHTGTRCALTTRSATTPSTVISSVNITPGQSGNQMRLNAAPGEVLSFGLYLKCSVASFKAQVSLLWKDGSGTTLGAVVDGPLSGPLTAAVWNLVKFENATAPAGTAYVTVQVQTFTSGANTVGGELARHDSLMVNSGPTVQPYQDGTNTAGCGWLAATNQSATVRWPNGNPVIYNRAIDASLESGLTGAQVTTDGTRYTVTMADATCPGGARFGIAACKTVRTATSPDTIVAGTYVTPLGNVAHIARIPCTGGVVFSASLYEYYAGASHRAQLNCQFRDSAGAITGTTIGTGTISGLPASAWNLLKLENITAPPLAAWMTFFCTILNVVGTNIVGGETVWMDGLMVNSGPTVLPYADGSTPGWVWSNGANLSPSVPATIGPWTRWNGAVEERLAYAGVWDGAASQPLALADVSVA